MKKTLPFIAFAVALFGIQWVTQGNSGSNQSSEKIIVTNTCISEKSELKLEIIKNHYYLSCLNESIINTIDPNKIKTIRIIIDPNEEKEILNKLGKIRNRIKGNIVIIELLDQYSER